MVGVVPGIVAVALEAELRVAAVEDELLPVAHGGCPERVIRGDVVLFGDPGLVLGTVRTALNKSVWFLERS